MRMDEILIDPFFFQFLLATLALGVFAGESAGRGPAKRSVYGEGIALSSLSGGHGLALDSGLGSGLAGGIAHGSGLEALSASSLSLSGLGAGPAAWSAGPAAWSAGPAAWSGAPVGLGGGHAIDLGSIANRHITITRKVGIPVPHPVPVPVERNVAVPVPHPVAVPVDRPYAVQVCQKIT